MSQEPQFAQMLLERNSVLVYRSSSLCLVYINISEDLARLFFRITRVHLAFPHATEDSNLQN